MANLVEIQKNEIINIIKQLDNCYFDGHTEFENFNPEQKINWLIQISLFVFEVLPFSSKLFFEN